MLGQTTLQYNRLGSRYVYYKNQYGFLSVYGAIVRYIEIVKGRIKSKLRPFSVCELSPKTAPLQKMNIFFESVNPL